MLVIQPSSIWSHCSVPSCSGRSPEKWCPLPAVNVTHPTPAPKNWIPLVTMETKNHHLIFFPFCAQHNSANSHASIIKFWHKYKMSQLNNKHICVSQMLCLISHKDREIVGLPVFLYWPYFILKTYIYIHSRMYQKECAETRLIKSQNDRCPLRLPTTRFNKTPLEVSVAIILEDIKVNQFSLNGAVI